MNQKQAYARLEAISQKIKGLYLEERKILNAMAKKVSPWKLFDILAVRNPETNRIGYYKVMEVMARQNHKAKTLSPCVRARRCTRTGEYRGYNVTLSPETLERAVAVRTSNPSFQGTPHETTNEDSR